MGEILTAVRAVNGIFNPVVGSEGELFWEQPRAKDGVDFIVATFLLTKDGVYLISDLLSGLLKLLIRDKLSIKEVSVGVSDITIESSLLKDLYQEKGKVWNELSDKVYVESMQKPELKSILNSVIKALQATKIKNIALKLSSGALEKASRK